jgi:hypothetical protein
MGRSIRRSPHCTAQCCTSACRAELEVADRALADTAVTSETAEAGPLGPTPAGQSRVATTGDDSSSLLDPGWAGRLAM